jgi:hypothetical protein
MENKCFIIGKEKILISEHLQIVSTSNAYFFYTGGRKTDEKFYITKKGVLANKPILNKIIKNLREKHNVKYITVK